VKIPNNFRRLFLCRTLGVRACVWALRQRSVHVCQVRPAQSIY